MLYWCKQFALLTNITAISSFLRCFFYDSIWQFRIFQWIAIPSIEDAIAVEHWTVIVAHFTRTAITLMEGWLGWLYSCYQRSQGKKFIFSTMLSFENSNHAPVVHYIIILIWICVVSEISSFYCMLWQILVRTCFPNKMQNKINSFLMVKLSVKYARGNYFVNTLPCSSFSYLCTFIEVHL